MLAFDNPDATKLFLVSFRDLSCSWRVYIGFMFCLFLIFLFDFFLRNILECLFSAITQV